MDLEFHKPGKENTYHKVYFKWDNSFNTNEKILMLVPQRCCMKINKT